MRRLLELLISFIKSKKKKLISLIIIIIILYFAFKFGPVLYIYHRLPEKINALSGLPINLIKALVILALIPLFLSIGMLFSFKKSRRQKGIIICGVYIALYFLVLFLATEPFEFSTGEPRLYYVKTPEGFRFYDSKGYDTKYGYEAKPITTEIMIEYHLTREFIKRNLQELRRKRDSFFDPFTGNPIKWYFIDISGNYEFFDYPGYHPKYRTELKPVTPEIVIDYEKKKKEQEEILKEREEIARKRAYINKHINPVIFNEPQRIDFGILIIEEEGLKLSERSRLIGQNIVKSFSIKNYRATANLFKNPFITEGNFKRLFNGLTQDVSKLRLHNYIDYLILGTKESSFFEDPRLSGLQSCSLILNLKIISARTGEILAYESFTQAGIGINREKAEYQAIDKILQEVKKFILANIED